MAAGLCTSAESGRIVFLDRDGVINRKAPPHEYVKSWAEFEFLPGVPEAIRRLNQGGYTVLVVTNQRGIARGMMSREDVDRLHRHMCLELEAAGAHIGGIFVCPHETGTCGCRKPEVGLFLQAERRYRVDKCKSWTVGDSGSDILAGRRYGVRTILIGDGKFDQDDTAVDLSGAADIILGGWQK